ncbi:MAG: hypothetical protein CO001_03205, partial [Candidatus Portnoybacteria bacterium CG_4_8_14_3_um_filter_40_10]
PDRRKVSFVKTTEYQRRQKMKKMLLFLGIGNDILFLLLLIAIFLLAVRDIAQWRMLPYLDEWTIGLIGKVKKRKQRR